MTESTANDNARSAARVGKRATVLVVDDEPYVTRGIQSALFRSPFEILVANSAADALGVLHTRGVDVVVSDECMPGTSGTEFLARVRAEFPATARIVLTGHGTLDVAARAINEGQIAFFLQKPCPPERLVEAISRALVSHGTPSSTRPSLDDAAIAQGFAAEDFQRLSAREREILRLVVDGQRPGPIAKQLFISEHTVRNHLKAIYRKLDVHSQADLMRKGRGLAVGRK